MFERLIKKHLDFSWWFILGFVLLFVLAVPYALQLEVDPSFSALISSDSQNNVNERVLVNALGQTDVFLVVLAIDSSSRLQQRPLHLNQTVPYIEQIQQVMQESFYVQQVLPYRISDDGQYAQLPIRVQVPRNNEGTSRVIEDLNYYLAQSGAYPGVITTLSGFPVLINRVNTLLIGDNIKTILLTFFIVALVLYWYFKSYRLTIITLIIPVVSLIFLVAIMALFNIPITITLAAVGIIVLGLGIDYTIHMIIAYESYLEQEDNAYQAIVKAVNHLSKAIVASYITTVVGFSALMLGISPSSQNQGLVLVIAITLVFLATVLLLPPLLFIGARHYVPSSNKIFDALKKGLANLATYQVQYPKIVLCIIGGITIIMIGAASQVSISTSNDNWIPSDDPISLAFRESSLAFGNDFSSLTLVVRAQQQDLFWWPAILQMQQLVREIEQIPGVKSVDSPFHNITTMQQAYVFKESKPIAFSQDFSLTTMRINVDSFDNDESGSSALYDTIVQHVDSFPNDIIDVSFFGDIVRFRELGVSLGRDTGVTTMYSFIFVLLTATLIYGSIRVGIVALAPIIIAVIWTVGVMALTGIPFTALSTGLIALVLGIGVDFSLHIVNSIEQYEKQGKSLAQAIKRTMLYSGSSLLLTSITTFIGFASLVLATLLGIRRLGLALAFSIVCVFIVSIAMVPAIIALRRKKKKKNNRKKYRK
ncbi:MAG: efflux RND transporter permease subunit [Candidatus Woesearchaeota archaeon]